MRPSAGQDFNESRISVKSGVVFLESEEICFSRDKSILAGN